nr:hypothetical protein [uncultured Aminipila sp.]
MPKKAIIAIYKQLELSLTDKSFLKEIELSKKKIVILLEEHNWLDNIGYLMSLEEITCKEILKVSKSTLETIELTPSEGWLEFVKNTIVEELFPTGQEIKKSIGAAVLLRIIRVFINWQNQNSKFDPAKNIEFVNDEELQECSIKDEYNKFIKFWKENYIYEFMLIFKELTAFNTGGHIAGVHFVAMHIARQLKQLSVPIDIALVSGAAAGHDLGKYGCKPSEAKKIPYLHYYYSNQLFKENNMPTIGHIAANHSTWDLELENLSVESLVLIYADFRVKSSRDEKGNEIVNFYSLKASFDVILNKLDNVDESKKQRYIRVYSKLIDFEKYIKSLGVSVEMDSNAVLSVDQTGAPLLNTQQTIEKLKFLAIEHNITLMSKLNNETSFVNLLEKARSEKQWKNIRAYLNIFSEYSTYMTQKQKLSTLHFLYELLMNREGDIRRQAAGIMAAIIVNYDEEFRKELPVDANIDTRELTALDLWKQFLKEIVFPDYKVTEQHKRWIGYSLKSIIATLLEKCRTEGEREKYLSVFFSYFENISIDDGTAFTLLAAVLVVPLDNCSENSVVKLMNFGAELSKREPLEIKIGALRFAKYAVTTFCEKSIMSKIKPYAVKMMDNVSEDLVSIVYLKYKILAAIGEYTQDYSRYGQILYNENQIESDLYLENLKVGTPWVIKAVNIEFLLDKLSMGRYEEKLHIATHFSNLIKVSERVTVRHSAGKGLLQVIKLLTLDQRNEIIIELTKGLEIGEYQFSKYIPEYLGELAMYLHPRELDELIHDLKKLEDSTNRRIASVTLDTLAVMIRRYPSYKNRFEESIETYERRRDSMLGMLIRGLANYDEIVSQEAFLVIGQSIFGNNELLLEDKRIVFEKTYKKIVTLIAEKKENELAFYNNAAALNHLYRFISDYVMQYGGFDFKDNTKIAFFPGTFDPFSLSHKGIVQEIKKLGFEVYLALDEFSWSKKTQPRIIRKQIVSMSIADESDVYLFPDNISVNIANPNDLKQLTEIFANKELYMVVGSDVIVNASSYMKEIELNSIHHMNHIVFKRASVEEGNIQSEDLIYKYEQIKGKVIELKLPIHLEDISSTRIRENIDNNRDISNLIDTVAQNYIYKNSLYLREPQYKSIIRSSSISFDVIENNNSEIFYDVKEVMGDISEIKDGLLNYLEYKKVNSIVIRNRSDNNRVLGMALFHELDTVNLYSEFNNSGIASYIREHSSGKIVVLGAVIISDKNMIDELEQVLLTETIANCLRKGFTYAVYNPVFCKSSISNKKLEDVLQRQGFFRIAENQYNSNIYFVDMKYPIILFENMEMRIKSPFNKNERVLQVLKEAHKIMQESLTKIYKGNLVLSFNSAIMHHKLVDMITEVNGVPREATKIRNLGPYMCVPFGKILDGKAVPNTVTKTLHTEKIFDAEIKGFKIKEYPNYTTLENQIGTIESFNRPIMLVDDLLHKGHRLKELDPIFKRTGVKVEKIIVGVLSGRGKDLMAIQGRNVDSAYFIPNLKTWFVDDAIYPFIGGDSVEREYSLNANLLPSINLILPYALPSFLAEENKKTVFDFSLTCLESTKKILEVLEEEFQKAFEKNLTLSRLGEVINSPRCPDKGYCVRYDENLAPSIYVSNDIEKLMRLKNII